jgi:hypothetical protein
MKYEQRIRKELGFDGSTPLWLVCLTVTVLVACWLVVLWAFASTMR